MKGKSISLSLINIDDAEFICQLRNNEELNKHISQTSSDVSAQKKWIEEYKDRESNNKEFYFIINRNDDQSRIGTIRLYAITEDERFCWGSWILNENKTRTAALESAILLYKFAFDELKLSSSYFQVDKRNTKVISFHLKSGAKVVAEDDINYHFEFSRENYLDLTKQYAKLLA